MWFRSTNCIIYSEYEIWHVNVIRPFETKITIGFLRKTFTSKSIASTGFVEAFVPTARSEK
jgi:hypothetical protein